MGRCYLHLWWFFVCERFHLLYLLVGPGMFKWAVQPVVQSSGKYWRARFKENMIWCQHKSKYWRARFKENMIWCQYDMMSINSFVLELECGCSCRVVISYGPQIVLFRDLKKKDQSPVWNWKESSEWVWNWNSEVSPLPPTEPAQPWSVFFRSRAPRALSGTHRSSRWRYEWTFLNKIWKKDKKIGYNEFNES